MDWFVQWMALFAGWLLINGVLPRLEGRRKPA
jgi:hypothetical protein